MEMPYQLKSISFHVRPWRAICGCAWWLLCQPSPNVRIATQKLFLDVSSVRKRCLPHMCVAELTSHVVWRPITVRRNTPQRTIFQPPMASRIKPDAVIGTQCHLLMKV